MYNDMLLAPRAYASELDYETDSDPNFNFTYPSCNSEPGNLWRFDTPSTGSDWQSDCMESKYKTFVTLQQMIDFSYIGGLTKKAYTHVKISFQMV